VSGVSFVSFDDKLLLGTGVGTVISRRGAEARSFLQ
jgi:hypothetical protein